MSRRARFWLWAFVLVSEIVIARERACEGIQVLLQASRQPKGKRGSMTLALHPHAPTLRAKGSRFRPLVGDRGRLPMLSGRFLPLSEAMRRHQIVGERMEQRHRLGLDETTHRKETKTVVLAVGVDPLDQFTQTVDRLAGCGGHSAAPVLEALRFARPLAFAVPQRCSGDVLTLGWRWRID